MAAVVSGKTKRAAITAARQQFQFFPSSRNRNLLPVLSRSRIGRCRWRARRCWRSRPVAMHSLFETADACTQPAHHLWNLFPTKKQKHNGQNYKPMNWAHLSHNAPAFYVSRPAPQRRHLLKYTPDYNTPGASQAECHSSRGHRALYHNTLVAVPPGDPFRSRYSNNGMACFRVTPASSLNAGTLKRDLFSRLRCAQLPTQVCQRARMKNNAFCHLH